MAKQVIPKARPSGTGIICKDGEMGGGVGEIGMAVRISSSQYTNRGSSQIVHT